MGRMEDRLAGLIAALAVGGLAGCGDEPSDRRIEGICAGDPPPANFSLGLGYVTVPPGGTCPDPAEAPVEAGSCDFRELQGEPCGLDHVDTDQVLVNTGYGSYFTDADGAPTTSYGYPTGDPVDVCWYEAVFYLDPNHPTCGRPLVEDGRAVVAEAVPDSPWCGSAPMDHGDADTGIEDRLARLLAAVSGGSSPGPGPTPARAGTT